MVKKIFIDANTLLLDSLQLAEKVYKSGFRPDIFIGIWRGGTPPGIAIHEFFNYKRIKAKFHTALKVESYLGIEKHGDVLIEGMDQILKRVTPGDKILIIDDIFDTGKSIEAIRGAFKREIRFPIELKIATVYYKPEKNLTAFIPDFFQKSVNEWVVFPHELEGLTQEELKGKGPDIFRILTE